MLVSKPPAAEVAAKVLAAAEASGKPVVVIFLGADPASITRKGVYGAATLAQAADMAVALADGRELPSGAITLSEATQRKLGEVARTMAPTQRYVRGIFSGGTFCFEAQLIHAARRLQGLLQHADCRQFRCSRATAAAAATRSSTWATTSSRRDVRIR